MSETTIEWRVRWEHRDRGGRWWPNYGSEYNSRGFLPAYNEEGARRCVAALAMSPDARNIVLTRRTVVEFEWILVSETRAVHEHA